MNRITKKLFFFSTLEEKNEKKEHWKNIDQMNPENLKEYSLLRIKRTFLISTTQVKQ